MSVDPVLLMIGVIRGIDTFRVEGVRSLNDIEELHRLADDLGAACDDLYALVRSGQVSETWRSTDTVPWRGP